ncbi:MAG: tetratricopeptide repeat protein [Candidatus Thermoplasmatota archaeon]|nr:tetratricopeptide repeat protein [Candidatus Thermoplasmatota archaeon]
MQRTRTVALLFIIVLTISLAFEFVTAEGAEANSFDVSYLYPLGGALVIAGLMWKFFIPIQLANLQVAFEIDDDLYEVHRVTRDLDDARDLLSEGSVGYGLGLYMMGMTGVLILIGEFLFDPDFFYTPSLYIIALLVGVPILISPWETMNAQLSRNQRPSSNNAVMGFFRRTLTLLIIIGITIASLMYGLQESDTGVIEPFWLALAMLVFMSPTIFAYGRIMGASWNMLLIGKWRTSNGRKNPIDPDKPKFFNRLFSLLLVIFLLTMPITALNGIVTVVYVLILSPDNYSEVLNYGGIIGHSIYVRIDLISEILFHWEFIKSLPQFLSLYLSLNIAIVGLAFIFELTRNLMLGGQSFGGVFGVIIDSPRDIRTEVEAQTRQLKFAFAGFSGYTVLLLLLVCYKEFGDLMPFTDTLEEKYGFDEGMRLLATWMFIAVGQLIFLLTWLVSIIRFGTLRNLRFDLNPDERREGAVRLAGGDWMRTLVDEAALIEDLDTLIRFQRRSLDGDPSVVRFEKARARMWELAIRGLWPSAIEEARKVLAQAGGDDDVARMIIATGHIASRRLDAARDALMGLEQPEGYDEPELLAFVCEWLDPFTGNVTEDDFWDWENNSCINNLQQQIQMIRSWNPKPSTDFLGNDRLSRVAQLSMISLMRAQRMHDDALDLALKLVRADPTGVRPRIAAALCLVDKGDWHSAKSVVEELIKSDKNDPRVQALSAIIGVPVDGEEFEVALVHNEGKALNKWINQAPCNSIAALGVKGGMDEAINANLLVAAHEATRKQMTPKYQSGRLSIIFNYFILIPLFLLGGIFVYTEYGQMEGVVGVSLLLLAHSTSRRVLRQQRRLIRHRDQKAMVAYAKRMKRFKVAPDKSNIPVGTHLLLSGILISVNGVILDIGLPGWLTEHLPKDSDKAVKSRLKRRSGKMQKARPPRLKPLGEGWWLKRPKEEGAETPALERLVGKVAYRGRPSYIDRKKGVGARPTGQMPSKSRPVHTLDLGKRGIPTNTRVSERNSAKPKFEPRSQVRDTKRRRPGRRK